MTAFQKSNTYLKHHFFVNFLNNPIDMGWAIIITFNNFSAISYLFITKGRKARKRNSKLTFETPGLKYVSRNLTVDKSGPGPISGLTNI